MDWKTAEENEDGSVQVPASWLHLYYYESLNILFRFENALRIFTYIILKKEMKERWDEAAIEGGSTIRTETRKRITQAREHGYLGYEVSSPMLFLNSGELTQIITSEAYWKYFAKYFKASKSIVLTKLQEIGTIRNSLAHFRPIKSDDIDLIKQNSKHILLEIENCLHSIVSITSLVPTNSPKDWYQRLSGIGNERARVSLHQSDDRNWIRIQIEYVVPTFQKTSYARHLTFNVGNVRTDQILKKFPTISGNCIYVSEQPMYGSVNSEGDFVASNSISIVFHESALSPILSDIEVELRKIVDICESETQLLESDRLALGELVESKYASAALKEHSGTTYWEVNASHLGTPVSSTDSVEFWGQRYNFHQEFIAHTHQYPWMPSTVSKESFLF